MFDITNIDSWRKDFGLFPLSIMPTNTDKYALLNGGNKDFCIDLNPSDDTGVFNSYAWSANTKNYLAVSNDNVIIYNWLRSNTEKLKINDVQNNIEAFYSYLGKYTYSTGNDVVPFVINLFRKMRNITREEQSPQEALNLLYILLASLECDLNDFDYNKWEIKQIELPDQFEVFVEELKNGIGNAKPNLSIILRHCSGPIFQEAHRAVQTFYSDRDLFGNISSKIITTSKEYSSSHYTPQFVARSIVEQCLKKVDLNNDCIRIFDPACGSAEFLTEILKQLHNQNYSGNVIIKGWDCSESAISTSRFLLNYEKENVWKDKLFFNIQIVEDSLTLDWGTDNDIVLMNPPFVSWELLSKLQRESVADCLYHNISKPNQAIAFFKKAMCSLSGNGILGCVMPTSLFESEGYKPIRTQLKDELRTILAAKLGNFIFDNALTDVSVYVGQKNDNILQTRLIWCKNENGIAQEALRSLRKIEASGLIEIETEKYSIYSPYMYPDIQDSWKIISRKSSQFKEDITNAMLHGFLVSLQSIFTVKQGIRTGSNDLFIISADEYIRLSDNEKSYYRCSVDNDAIYYSKLKGQNYVWYPYNSTGIAITSEEQLRNECPISYSRFITHKNKLENRASISNKDHWWALSRHREWLLKRECRLVSTEFGTTKSFSLDIKGDYVIERGYAWIPKKEFKMSDYYFYLALFSSSTFEDMLSIYTRELAGGGWYDFAAKYTNQIPIPNVHHSGLRESRTYIELSLLGKAISEDGSYFYSERINELVSTLFNWNKV